MAAALATGAAGPDRITPVTPVDVSPTNASRLLAYPRSPDYHGTIQIHDLAFDEPAPRAVKKVPQRPRPGPACNTGF